MITCDDAELTLAMAGMGEVDAASLREARAHAQTCQRCGSAERAYAEVFDIVALAAVPEAPPPDLRRRILDAVAQQAQQAQPQPHAEPWWRRLWRRIPTGRPLTAFGFAAAATAVALAAVLILTSRGPAPVVTQQVQAGVNQPGLTGTLTYYRSSGDAVVSLTGLPASPRTATGGDGVYELWLVHSGGGVAPAGVLTQQSDGTWRAVVHRGDASDTAIAGTLEPAPGTATPTGSQVFQAPLPTT
jgi:anti-sigma-K factor RskA